jgi:epoxyqueuosine reductase QueG
MNQLLDRLTGGIAAKLNGIPIQATLSGYSKKLSHVSEYFPLVISHRTVAVNAGHGWWGKNGLLVTKKKGCALRLASVIVPKEFDYAKKMESGCGDCSACLEACVYLRKEGELEDYREKCRKRLNRLNLKYGGCGICIRACFEQGHWR